MKKEMTIETLNVSKANFKKEFDRMCRENATRLDRRYSMQVIANQKYTEEFDEYRRKYLGEHLLASKDEPISSDSTFVKIEDYDEADIN